MGFFKKFTCDACNSKFSQQEELMNHKQIVHGKDLKYDCKECFDKKEESFEVKKKFCALCSAEMGFIRHNPKSKWMIEGQLCRKCWDEKKAELG